MTDSETATNEARDRCLALVDELEAARQEVIELGEMTVWAQIYPHESLQTLPPSHELAPSKRIRERVMPRTSGDLLAASVFELLRADVKHFAQVSTVEQAAAAKGVSERQLTGKQAMWHESEEYAERAKSEKQRLIDDHARVFWAVRRPRSAESREDLERSPRTRSVMRKILILLVVAGAFLAYPTMASAGGWAGSRYDKSDCAYSNETATLFCEGWFTEETHTTVQFAVADRSCASSLRLIERTGWLVTTYRGWGLFAGRVPHADDEIAGNEDSFTETWRDYSDLDLGCL